MTLLGKIEIGPNKPTSYERFLEQEELPVIRGFHVEDFDQIDLAPWKRKGGKGAYVCLEGTGGTNDAYVAEIPPGGSLNAEKYMFEELIYVLSGRGATTIWNEGGPRQTFEWQAGSLFSPPLNVWRQHFNGSGDQPARFLAVTSAPMIIDLYHNEEFVFNNPFVFSDRYSGEEGYFSADGKLHPGRLWESNFIPDVPGLELIEWKERGAGGRNMRFELSNNTMCGHVSEFPVGTYKKGHRHGPGAHVILLAGDGYSLLWRNEGDTKIKVDWKKNSMFVPPDQWFHQHFNVGANPARYLALRWGSRKYPTTAPLGGKGTDEDIKSGGAQIEYRDEDPAIRKLFEEECAKRGVESEMARFFEK